jgi:hypothetical protein
MKRNTRALTRAAQATYMTLEWKYPSAAPILVRNDLLFSISTSRMPFQGIATGRFHTPKE